MQTGLNNILLIAPNNDWGDRTTNAFRNSIAESADLNVVERRFEDGESYLPFVRSVLGVDQSQTRANELKRITGKTFEFTPRRRQDIDMIGLLANNAQARQINPALAFYYADDLPVFATSLVNDDQASKISNLDLNGIRFCDMPWKLAPSSAFAEHLQLLLPGASSSLGGLFALGTDAFNVIPRLKQLRELESLSFYGFTGKLSMEDQTLVRSLMWGSFEQGEVLTVPTIVESI
jgi:outer membrane PBP1 activator LpoA protein